MRCSQGRGGIREAERGTGQAHGTPDVQVGTTVVKQGQARPGPGRWGEEVASDCRRERLQSRGGGCGRGGMRLPSGQHAPHQHLPSPARPHLFLFPPLNLLHTAVRTPLHPSSLLKRTADARTGKGAPRLRPPLGPRPCRDPGP